MAYNLELVYIWVEKYRNIKQAGFNLSSRFTVSYEKESNSLHIEKNKDLFKIFPEYTNIRVIVGKNGSGKSSLIEQILLILLGVETKSFLLFYDEERDCFFSSRNLNSEKKVRKIETKQLKNLFSLYFNYALDTMSPQYFDKYEDKLSLLFKPNDKINLLLVPDKNFRRVYIETIYRDLAIDYFTVKKGFNFNDEAIHNLIKETFNEENFVFLPEKIEFKINERKYKEIIEQEYESIIRQYYTKEIMEHYVLGKRLFNHSVKFKKEILKKILKVFKKEGIDLFDLNLNKQNKEDFEKKLLILIFIYFCFKESFKEGGSICQSLKYFLKDNINEDGDLKLRNNFCIPLIKKKLEDLKELISPFSQTFDFVNAIDFFIEPQNYNEKLTKNLFYNIPPFVECNMIDKNGRIFLDLSFGEKLLNVLFFKILGVISEKRKDTINIFYDEFDIGMHPDMQRRFIDFIVKVSGFINKIGVKKINWILATHSPFILSDVPKQNVIVMEKGKEENKFEKSENTFGANIYDIFENGFFLDNSIGKYSEETIKALSLTLSFEQAIYLLEKEKNAFVLRNILNECYKMPKKTKLTREKQEKKKERQDKELLKKVKKEKKKFLKNVFKQNNLDFEKYESVFFKGDELSKDLDKYITIIGDPIVRNHLLAIFEIVKKTQNESK